MIGDGVNDVLSIKCVDIGIVMGIIGIEVVKGVVDMILIDDNFVIIVLVVKEGCIIFFNIKKVIYFLLFCNIGEIIIIFLGVIIGILLFLNEL